MKYYKKYIIALIALLTALLGSVMGIKPMMNLFIALTVLLVLVSALAQFSLDTLVKDHPVEARKLAQTARRPGFTTTVDLSVAAILAIGGSWVMFAVWIVLWIWSLGISGSILKKLPKDREHHTTEEDV